MPTRTRHRRRCRHRVFCPLLCCVRDAAIFPSVSSSSSFLRRMHVKLIYSAFVVRASTRLVHSVRMVLCYEAYTTFFVCVMFVCRSVGRSVCLFVCLLVCMCVHLSLSLYIELVELCGVYTFSTMRSSAVPVCSIYVCTCFTCCIHLKFQF